MALKAPDMEDCTPKKRCLTGPNVGQAYTPGNECETTAVFDEELCDCIPLSSRYWKLTFDFYDFAANANCTGQPNNGYCVLETEPSSTFSRQYDFGVNEASFGGAVGSFYRGDCGGDFGPGPSTGTYEDRINALWVADNNTFFVPGANASPSTNTTSREDWYGFYQTYGLNEGALWLAVVGPFSSGAVNCNEVQAVLVSAERVDSNGNPI